MRRTIVLLSLFLYSATAGANPSGMWPPEARGGGLPKVDWVLVVPAVRTAQGELEIWNNADSWTDEWTVPRPTPGGLRAVAIKGDASDIRTVSGHDLDGMDLEALGYLAEKYSAPAVAVAVKEEGAGTAVAAWVPGSAAVWDEALSLSGHREAALSLIDGLIGSSGNEAHLEVAITGQRSTGTGLEFRLEAADTVILDVINSLPGLEVRERLSEREVVVATTEGRGIEEVLTAAGLSVGY